MGDLYLGREVDGAGAGGGSQVRLGPDVLTRHAVCLGSTGSGKTGLCTVLLEELALAGVPAIVVDPKGDLANLALRFREHRPEDLAPWVDGGVAAREGITVDALAAKASQRWREGLDASEVSPARRAAWADDVDVRVYTPGSDAAAPLDVLGGLGAAPPAGTDVADLVGSAAASLLTLVGHKGDPVADPAHVVLAHLLSSAWDDGRSLDLAGIIGGLVDPPFDKVGVFPLEQFMPRSERMALATRLNAVLAAPGFAAWQRGERMDLDAWLAPGGRTTVRVLTLSHLGDAERAFFLTQLLTKLVAWSRRQPGTSALRAVLYLDEAVGFCPPHPHDPPTKRPLLTLMKQARAVGFGVVLATQNPVDLDYKALSNANTWMVGLLRTAQDRERVVAPLAGADVEPAEVNRVVSGLPKRVFAVRAAGGKLLTMRSRWAMSYLRGPLTPAELGELDVATPAPVAAAAPIAASPPPAAEVVPEGYSTSPPPPPKGYDHRFLSPEVALSARFASILGDRVRPRRADGQILWEPALSVRLNLQFDEGRDFVERRDDHRLLYPLDEDPPPSLGDPVFEARDLLRAAPDGLFAPLPDHLDEARELDALRRTLVEEVWRGETTRMFKHGALKLTSRAGEDRDAFDARCREAVQDRIDAEVAKLSERVERDVKRLEDKRAKLEADISRREMEANAAMANEVVSAGETLWGMLFGGRSKHLSTAITKRKQTLAAKDRLERTTGGITELESEIYDAQSKLRDRIVEVENEHRRVLDDVEEVEVGLEKNDITLDELTIVWIPVTRPV